MKRYHKASLPELQALKKELVQDVHDRRHAIKSPSTDSTIQVKNQCEVYGMWGRIKTPGRTEFYADIYHITHIDKPAIRRAKIKRYGSCFKHIDKNGNILTVQDIGAGTWVVSGARCPHVARGG